MPPKIEIDDTIEHRGLDAIQDLPRGTEVGLRVEPAIDAAEASIIRNRPGRPDLGSDAAAAALIAMRVAIFRWGGVRVQVLGKSDSPEMERRSTIFGTGSSLTFVEDMTRRAMFCTLDNGVERPKIHQSSSTGWASSYPR